MNVRAEDAVFVRELQAIYDHFLEDWRQQLAGLRPKAFERREP